MIRNITKLYILLIYMLVNYVMLKNLDYCFSCNKYDKILRDNLVKQKLK